MSKFERIKSYYDKGFWTESMVRNAVKKHWITEEQFEEIVGSPFES